MSSMSKSFYFKVLLIPVLLSLFPLLWLYNQRLNYRKFLTLDTKFSINNNTYNRSELSSPSEVLRFMNDYGLESRFHYDVVNSSVFNVLGRKIFIQEDSIEVYEYSSPEDALKEYNLISTLAPQEENITPNLYIYKNLIIFNLDNSEKVKIALEEIFEE